MSWTVIVTTLVTTAVSALLLGYLNTGFRKKIPINKRGNMALRMHKAYHIFGVISMGIPALIMITTFFVDDEGVYAPLFFITLLFGGLGLLCLKYYHHHRIIFDSQRITVTSWKDRTQTIKWEAIKKIKRNATSGYIEIHTDSDKLILHYHLTGLEAFLKVMEAKTEWTAQELNLPF